jgi:Tol biopolymer transport system component
MDCLVVSSVHSWRCRFTKPRRWNEPFPDLQHQANLDTIPNFNYTFPMKLLSRTSAPGACPKHPKSDFLSFLLLVCWMVPGLWGQSATAAVEDGQTVWKVSGGLMRAHHQYYDVPAWNCNGSALLIQGEGKKSYVVRASGAPPVEIPGLSDRDGYIQWDAHDPDVFYYVLHEKGKTVIVRQRLSSGERQSIYQTDGKLGLAVPHPDGKHLLLVPQQGDQCPAEVVNIGSGTSTRVTMPGPVHRVRFTKHADLSLFCNLQTEKKNAAARENRISWLVNLQGKAQILIKGNAGHPDWDPQGNRLSFFLNDALHVVDRNGQLIRTIPGLSGHQSWLSDGRRIISDIDNGSAGNKGWIVVVDTQSGAVTPLVRHRSRKTSDQSTHPHVIGSPDGTKAVFNSTNEGKEEPQVYVVQVRQPSAVLDAGVSRRGPAVVLHWELTDARAEIAHIIIRQVTKKGVVDVASIPADETSWTDSRSQDVVAYEICTQEYSGLMSDPVVVSY